MLNVAMEESSAHFHHFPHSDFLLSLKDEKHKSKSTM